MNENTGSENATLEELEAEEINNAKKTLQKIYTIWSEFGMDLNKKTDRAKLVWNHVHTLLYDICDEENTCYEDYKERIKNYAAKIKELCEVLEMTPSEINGSLIVKEEMLRQELDTLTKIKHKRLKAYQELKIVEEQYCQVLNLQEHQLPSNTGVPSEKDISEIEQHVKMLQEEKERREKKFLLARKELTTILEVTELTPESSLEKDILSGKDTMSLTNETFKALEEVICKAQKKKAELEAKKRNLIEKLTVLWQRLKVEEHARLDFLSKHGDCRLSTIQSIQQELEKCEALKRANIRSFISNLRAELVQLWDKCHVPQPERDLFFYFSSTDSSDEALEAHEAEVDQWKRHYEKVEHVLKKIEKRRHLWDRMVVFENKANDPNRFKNRKGNLLKEERERKKLQKDLPALENNIFEDIVELKEKDGLNFLYHGEDFKTYVTNQWIERNNQKEAEKMERQNKHLLQLGNEATLGTPLKRALAMNSPKSCPAKMFKSSAATPAVKRPKAVPSTVAKTGRLFQSAKKPPKPEQNILKEKNGKTATKPPESYQERPPETATKPQNEPQPESSKSSALNGTSYTAFSSELDKTARYNFRSSVLATKKRGGSRISKAELNNSKKRSAAKSLRKSLKNTSSGLTPARGKLGLPFLI